ncbi:MAG: hypothetical protein ACRDH5_07375, partial [bacterium]
LSISPESTAAGGPDLTVTVMGNDFVPSSVVRWGSTELATTYVGSDQLAALVPASLISFGQVGVVSVYTPPPGGGVSAGRVLLVNNPVPSLAMISPTSTGAGGGDFSLSVTGSNFVSTSEVQWNGVGLPTVFTDSGHLTTNIPVTQVVTPGTATVNVRNPAPGGGVSGSATFTITDFALSVDPGTRTVAAGSPASYTITLTPQGGSFSNAISLSCSAGVPSRASCNFQPSSLTPGAAAAASTLTISTAAPSSAMALPPGSSLSPIYAALLPLPALILLGGFRRLEQRRLGYLLTVFLLAAMVVHTGCGGGGGNRSVSRPPVITPGTPPGNYTITIRSVSGSLERTTTVTLVVQ